MSTNGPCQTKMHVTFNCRYYKSSNCSFLVVYCDAHIPDVANSDVTLTLNETSEQVTVNWTCITGHVFADDATSRTMTCDCGTSEFIVGNCTFKAAGAWTIDHFFRISISASLINHCRCIQSYTYVYVYVHETNCFDRLHLCDVMTCKLVANPRFPRRVQSTAVTMQ